MVDNDADAPKPAWEPLFGEQMIGCTVLIGLTYCDAAGVVQRQEQLHGMVVEADPRTGFRIRLGGSREGDSYHLPPHPSAFQRAQAGRYELSETGEVIVDPDYLTT